MVQGLLRILLKVDTDRQGIFGGTAAYYGTVEEQGRKTLHLHLLIWIEGCLSPQDIRDKLLADPAFESRFLLWLESCHSGDYGTGSEEELEAKWEHREPDRIVNGRRRKGKSTLLIPDAACSTVSKPPSDMPIEDLSRWYVSYRDDVDRIVFCSNRHDRDHMHGCLRGDPEYCRARFPRELHDSTVVDRNSGAVRFKKQSAWINTYNPVLSACMRFNTDVTCLLSGTQVRAIIAYVTDYVTKSTMNTHNFFKIIKTVLERNTELLDASGERRDHSARKLVSKFVNAISAGTEIGGPAAAAHLLGYPDHYTDHVFKLFYWRGYLRRFVEDLPPEQTPSAYLVDNAKHDRAPGDNVVLGSSHTAGVVPLSKVNDYVYRPLKYP
ncbi:hypothetical protein C8Q79DRAFT_1024297 [Trametes meyenii]|nr:hypothetical protein C8Q79DRAFT_1024297 [Trametes meyenii]